MTAGTLSLWIGSGFALAAAAAALPGMRDAGRALVAARCMALSAAFTTLAAGLLVAALHRAELSVAFVARHVTVGLPAVPRWMALFSDATGAGLAAAVVTGLTVAWVARRGRAPGLAGAGAVTVLVLAAAPLAGDPWRLQPWLPVDGLGVSPFFRDAMSIAWAASVVGLVACATVALGRALDAWAGGSRVPSSGPAVLALAFAGWIGPTSAHASVAAGLSASTSPLQVLDGAWVATLVVAACGWLVSRSSRAPRQARVESALGTVLAGVGLVLASGGDGATGWPVRAMWGLALVVSASGCWRASRARGADGTRPAGQAVSRRLATGALVTALLAAGLGALARETEVAVPSGGSGVLPLGGRLAHVGLSRYDDAAGTVLALALDLRGPGRTVLGVAEQREYTDARGSVIGSLVRRPARLDAVFGTTFVWLTGAGAADAVTLRAAAVPGYWLWWVGAVLVAALAVVTLARGTPAGAAPPEGE